MITVRIDKRTFQLTERLTWKGSLPSAVRDLNEVTEIALEGRGPADGFPRGIALQAVIDAFAAEVILDEPDPIQKGVEY